MINRIKLLVGLGIISLFVISCNETDSWKKQERSQIDSYIKGLGDTAYVLETSGLYYIELKTGTGRMPVAKDTVSFRYVGMFLDRVVFDSNLSATSPYGTIIGSYGIIQGLDEGLRYMKEGGKARFIIPSSLGYGAAGAGRGIIPGYTPLLFEIELESVKDGPGK
jgi:FKBP-type peptidyl-prolyl cis-trans isomerase